MGDNEFRHLPEDLPVPEDYGACDHLGGLFMPHVKLQSAGGVHVDAGDPSLGRSVFFFYPRTGIPEVPLPEGWDSIPAPVAARLSRAATGTVAMISGCLAGRYPV